MNLLSLDANSQRKERLEVDGSMTEFQGEPYTVTIQLKNSRCNVLCRLDELGVQHHSLVDVRGLSNGSLRHLVSIPVDQIKNNHENPFVTPEYNNNGNTFAWFDSEECPTCETILSKNSLLVSGVSGEEDSVLYNFVAPNHESFKDIMFTLETRGLEPKILEFSKYAAKDNLLTQKQERALWLASALGFFKYPRSITMAELAQKLGISSSTLSELLRRGMRRLVDNYFKM